MTSTGGRSLLRQALTLALIGLGMAVGPSRPALADCTQSGTVVTCSGNTPGGFSTADNGLSLTVRPGATVGDTISLNDNNIVANFGAISFPDASTYGIAAGQSNIITNAGSITGGTSVVGIGTGDFSMVTNTGTVTVGDGGTAISVGNASTVINSGVIRAGTAGFGIGIQDNGAVINNGTITIGGGGGYAIFGGVSDTIVNNGTISAGASSIGISVSGTGMVTNNGLVRVGNDGFGIIAINDGNTIVNNGSVIGGLGASAILVQGNSNTVINTGTLDGSVFVGFGTGNTLINSGLITITAPWTGVGVTHEVDGTFTQTASGTLALRFSTNNCCGFDQLVATGTANLGGTLRAQVLPGLYRSTTVYSGTLQFGSMTGRFANVQSSSVFLNASAVYNATSVDLVLTRIPFNQTSTGGANARAVGNVLEANYSTNLTGSLATFYGNLLSSSAPNTLSQLTGEIAAAGQNAAFAGFGQFFGLMFGQTGAMRIVAQADMPAERQTAAFRSSTAGGGTRVAMTDADACRGDACDATAIGRRVTAWAQGFGASGSVDGNAVQGSARMDMSSGGGATGIDMQFDRNFLLGFTMGTASAGYSLGELNSSGSWRAVTFGVYSGYSDGPAYLDAALGLGYGSFSTTRFIATGTMSERVDGATDAWQYGGRVEGGWRFAVDRHTVAPFAGLTVQSLRQNGYTETARDTATGAPGVLGLAVQTQTTTSVRSVLGGELRTSVKVDEATFSPRLRLGWAHEYSPVRPATVALASLAPASTFTVLGAGAAVDSAILSTGFDLDLTPRLRVFAQFDGEVAANARSFSGTGGIRLFW